MTPDPPPVTAWGTSIDAEAGPSARIRGFECILAAGALPALAAYIEYRTGGHCVIGRHSLADGRLLIQVFTYLLPLEDIELLQREVLELAAAGDRA